MSRNEQYGLTMDTRMVSPAGESPDPADPVQQIMDSLGIDATGAGYVASVQVKCPKPGPGGKVYQQSLGEFISSEHGQEYGNEVLTLAREELADGANIQQAMRRALGASAVRDETGQLQTQAARPEPEAPSDSKKK